MYFLLHTFSLTPNSTSYILNAGKWSNSIFILSLLILKYIYNQILSDFYSSIILLGDFHFYLSHFLFKLPLLLLKYDNWVLFPPLRETK